jgi:hypothetical protein
MLETLKRLRVTIIVFTGVSTQYATDWSTDCWPAEP